VIGEVFSIQEGKEVDPLLDVVGVLEANRAPARDILSRTCNVCSRLLGIFFPKKRKGMSKHLGKLVKMLNTPKDTTLLLKRSSTEISAKVTMVLAMSHGEKVDWDKVSSSMAKDDGRKV
jgi:hypothetical protein